MSTVEINGVRSSYASLAGQLRAAGLLERRGVHYSVKIGILVVAFMAGWAGLLLLGSSWAALGIAVWMAVIFTQVVFVGHDAGHQQVCKSRRANGYLGLAVGNLMTGLSFGWWVPKHNAHHAHPNQVDGDPDIGKGVVAFTPAIARQRGATGRVLARWQGWTFFPLLLLEGFALHWASFGSVFSRRSRSALLEASLLILHTAAYLALVFWVLSPLRAVVFIAVQQCLFGLYLGCTFAPNHKGMLILEPDTKLGFARRQVLTARNITGGRFTTFVYGGLNYQIEHHLFPTMPRPNLARAQCFVRVYCAEQDLPYREATPIGSYREALRYLHDVGR